MPLLILFLFFLSPSFLSSDESQRSYLIFWKVRQGQWITLVEPHYCHHFDIGGTNAPLRTVNKICSAKQNAIWISHNDKTHWRNLKRLNSTPCLAFKPKFESPQLDKLKLCHFVSKNIQSIMITNRESVFLLNNKFLLTGDTNQAKLPTVDYKIASAPQGGSTKFLKHKDAKLWICQPQHRTKRLARGCLLTSSFGNIAFQL